MRSAAFAFFVACLLASLLTPLVRRHAQRRGLVEGANDALKAHERPVPRLGGVAVVIAFFAPFLPLFLWGTGVATALQADAGRFSVFCLGALAIFAVGLWDDLRGAGARLKFAVETAVAAAVWLVGFRIDELSVPGLGPVDLGAFGFVVTLLWIVGITNAVNLVDGLDGLAGGVVLFAATAHVLMAWTDTNTILAVLCAALAGAVLGFLPQNFYPARIFLGDSGSLFAGYVLAVASIYGATHKTTTVVTLVAPVLVLGLPILDTLLAMHRRALRRRPLFDGDREHVHHRLLGLGLSQRRSVMLLYGLCAAFALAGLAMTVMNDRSKGAVLACLLLVLAVFERRLGFLRQARQAARPAGPLPALQRLRDAAQGGDLAALWEGIASEADELEVYRVALTADGATREWERPGMAGPRRDGVARLTFALAPTQTRPPAELVLEKRCLRRGAPELDLLWGALLAEYLGGRMSGSPAGTVAGPPAPAAPVAAAPR